MMDLQLDLSLKYPAVSAVSKTAAMRTIPMTITHCPRINSLKRSRSMTMKILKILMRLWNKNLSQKSKITNQVPLVLMLEKRRTCGGRRMNF